MMDEEKLTNSDKEELLGEETISEKTPLPQKSIKHIILLLLGTLVLLFVVYAFTSLIYKVSRGESWDPFAFLKKNPASEWQLPTVPTVPAQLLSSLMGESGGERTSTPAPASDSTGFETDREPTTEPAAETTTEPAEATTKAPAAEPSTQATTEATTEATTDAPTTEATAQTTTQDPPDFAQLSAHLQIASFSEFNLTGSQLVIAQGSKDGHCLLYFFEKKEDGWSLSDAVPVATARLGERQIVVQKPAGSTDVPAGYYALGPVYGHDTMVLTKMPYHKFDERDCWVTDPASRYYNRLVETSKKDKDWKTALEFSRAEAFKYAVLIQYNTDPVDNALGTAVFLNVETDGGTEASISTKESTLFALLQWLSPEGSPHILIYSYEADTQ